MNTAISTLQNASYSLMPTNFQEMLQFSEIVAKSDLAPKDYRHKPGNVMLAVQLGMEIGLQPMAAIQNIAVINGRPTLWGDAMLAVCQGSGQLQVFKETFDEEKQKATCTVKRKGYDEAVITFSIDDAKKAGLWGKTGPWTNYPKRMLALRARGFALRNNFADVLKGIQSAEEQRDIVEPQHTMREVVKPQTTVSKLLEGKDNDPEPVKIVEQPKEDKRTIFDHARFEEMREYFIEDPEKMILITKQKTLEDVSNLPIKFFDAIILGMEAGNEK